MSQPTEVMKKEDVLAILVAHDGLRASDRPKFVAYLTSVFEKAEAYDALAARVATSEQTVASAEQTIAALTERVTKLEPKQ